MNCSLPKPIESLRGVKVDVVTGDAWNTLAQADDGSVYAWGGEEEGDSSSQDDEVELVRSQDDEVELRTPRRVRFAQ
jgi:alpha-tubulin suppressor-like RCC1 family protein